MSDIVYTDLKGTQCTQCGLGEYQEATIYDDWQGTLHCTKCNHKTNRYGEVKCYENSSSVSSDGSSADSVSSDGDP